MLYIQSFPNSEQMQGNMKPKFKKRTLEQLNSLTEGLVRHEANEHQVERDYPLSRFKSDTGSSLKQYESGTYAHRRRAGKETPSERAQRMTYLNNEAMSQAEAEHEVYKKSQAAKAAPSRPAPTNYQQRSSQIDAENERAYQESKRNQTSSAPAPRPKHSAPSAPKPSTPQTDREVHSELRKKRLEYQKTPEYRAHYNAMNREKTPEQKRNELKSKRLGMSIDELADKKSTFRSAYMRKRGEEAEKQREQRSTKESVKQFMSREVPRDYKRERTKYNQPKR